MTDKKEKTRHIAGEKANPNRPDKLKTALRANLQRRKAQARAARSKDADPAGADETVS